MAQISNLFIDQGSDYSAIVTVEDTFGNPMDLTDFEVESQMRKSFSSTTAYDFLANIAEPLEGKVRIALSSQMSTDIPAGRYLYDIFIINPTTNKRKRVVQGIAVVDPQITQFT